MILTLFQGMIYLHDSYIISHGNLKSSNCLVDSRWVLQITDFGLHEFQCGQDLPPDCLERRERGKRGERMSQISKAIYSRTFRRLAAVRALSCLLAAQFDHLLLSGLLWRSPELLRQLNPPARGTQKGDVYSFAIILFEIIGRIGPWGPQEISIFSVIDRVKYPSKHGGQLYRPPLDELRCPEYVKKCIRDCWHEDPEVRPDFRYINIQLREMQSGL